MKKIELIIDDDGKIEVVFNTCYGGFSIRREAINRMIELGSEEALNHFNKCEGYPYKVYSYNPNVPRFDPILVRVVKELKNKASGSCSSLAIGKISLENLINIDDYDGKEEVKGCYDYKVYGKYDSDDDY
jgi:hypothetical protein